MRGRFVSKQRERKYDSIKRGIRQRWENTKIAETHSYSKIASTNETIESDDCHSVDNVPVDLEEVEIVYTENVSSNCLYIKYIWKNDIYAFYVH